MIAHNDAGLPRCQETSETLPLALRGGNPCDQRSRVAGKAVCKLARVNALSSSASRTHLRAAVSKARRQAGKQYLLGLSPVGARVELTMAASLRSPMASAQGVVT